MFRPTPSEAMIILDPTTLRAERFHNQNPEAPVADLD